uniref:Uncharacterized protein n=1 Tax=Timema bartmani TaxID=61472 RepID=A0A7R9I2P8_9NEOP|nr:unnamed protein product [Timema bartmani]
MEERIPDAATFVAALLLHCPSQLSITYKNCFAFINFTVYKSILHKTASRYDSWFELCYRPKLGAIRGLRRALRQALLPQATRRSTPL